MPAGAAAADGRLPGMLAGLGRFPEREIAGAFLFVAIVVDARAGLNAAEINPGELAVIRKLGDAIVDGAFARVGVRLLLQALDELDHGVDVVRGANPVFGSFNAERLAVGEESLHEFFGVFTDTD